MKAIKKEFILEGLNCANCANKIEEGIGKFEGVNSSVLNFATNVLTIEINDENKADNIIKESIDLINRLEPDVKVIEKTKGNFDRNGRNHSYESKINKKAVSINLIGVFIYAVVIIFNFNLTVEFSLFFIAYILIGGDILYKAIRNIIKGEVFDENFLMALATVGAFTIGEFSEAVAVMLFYKVGEFFQNIAVDRSKKSISSLMDIRPDFANLKVDNEIIKVDPFSIKVSDIIVVKPGEKVALDGVIIEGKSSLDTSALTGESMPREVSVNDEVLSGSINKNGLLVIKVTKEFSESTVSKILDLVQNASSKKAPTENFITKFAKFYTPIVVILALMLAFITPIVFDTISISQSINRALVFLVVSCPCALVVSIPLSFFGGIGGASKNGILIKGSNYLEALNNVDTVIFDKTGTLTKGVFEVTKINNFSEYTDEELLKYTAYAESFSNHPIATSIKNANSKHIDESVIKEYEEISGFGIKAIVEDKEIIVGNIKLLEKENIEFSTVDEIGTILYVVINKKYAGNIIISDEIKDDSKETVSNLKKAGVNRVVMLTGDNKVVGEKIAKELGIDKVYTELLPHEKVEKLEEIQNNKKTKGKVIFVGDGINDAPVLARADIGIAMGGVGSDAAIEASDIVLMTDEPLKLVSGLKIAKKTRNIVWQNIIFAMSVKIIVLILGAFGIATMWEAVFADVGVTLLAVINAMRIMKVDK